MRSKVLSQSFPPGKDVTWLARTLEEPLGRVGEAMSVFPLAGVRSLPRMGGNGQRPASIPRARQRGFHPEHGSITCARMR